MTITLQGRRINLEKYTYVQAQALLAELNAASSMVQTRLTELRLRAEREFGVKLPLNRAFVTGPVAPPRRTPAPAPPPDRRRKKRGPMSAERRAHLSRVMREKRYGATAQETTPLQIDRGAEAGFLGGE